MGLDNTLISLSLSLLPFPVPRPLTYVHVTDNSIEMETSELDESLPLELAESMAALTAFGSYSGPSNTSNTNGGGGVAKGGGANSAAAAAVEEGVVENGHHPNATDDVYDDDDAKIADNTDRPKAASSPMPSPVPSPPREKEPTMVVSSTTTTNEDNVADDDATTDDADADAVGSRFSYCEDSSEDGQASSATAATDDAIDALNMKDFPAVVREQQEERQEEVVEEVEVEPPPSEAQDTNVVVASAASFGGDGLVETTTAAGVEVDEEEEEGDIVRVDTDELSGISDPIHDLNRSPAKSFRAEEGTAAEDVVAEDAYDESTARGEEEERMLLQQNGVNGTHISDAGDAALRGGVVGTGGAHDDDNDGNNNDGEHVEDNHDIDERPSTPPSGTAPAPAPPQQDAGPRTPSANEDATQSAAFSNDVGKFWSDKAADNDEEIVAKQRPSAWLSKLLCDESLIPVNIDADRIIMMEDTDLKPCIQEPELDGEPAFLYGKKQQRAAGATAGGAAGAAAVDSVGAPTESTIGSAPVMPRFLPEANTTRQRTGADPPGKPPLPVPEQERAPTQGLAASTSPNPTPSPAAPDETTPRSRSKGPAKAPAVDATNTSAIQSPEENQSLHAEIKDLPPDASPLPDATPILASGTILTRSSLRSLVMKKWHKSHWVRYGPCALLVFRSKDDFGDWLRNPYHSQRQREYLVKARLDFYSEMKKPDVRGFKMTEIKLKSYEKKGAPMHNFKLERWTNLGVSFVAAFASPNLKEVEAVREAISHCLEMSPSGGLRDIDDLLVQAPSEKAIKASGGASSRSLKSP